MIRILVVDDDADLKRAVSTYLNDSGFEARGCLGANDAYQEMYNKHYDLIVSDIMMPDIDGFEFARTVRRVNGHIPILFMSARDDLPAKQKGFQLGIDDYMVKPFDFMMLAQRVYEAAGESLKAEAIGARMIGDAQKAGNESLEERIANLFLTVGIPAHIKGYQFLRDAILLAVEDHEYINAVTKRLYPEIAKRNGTTASRVERAIRHAIEVAWDRGDVDTLNGYFGYTIHSLRGKPTNSEFIAMIADKIRLDKRRRA